MRALKHLKHTALHTDEPQDHPEDPQPEQHDQSRTESRRPPKRPAEDVDRAFMAYLDKRSKEADKSEEDEDEDRLFMMSQVASLKRLSPKIKSLTKIKIMEIINFAEFGHVQPLDGPSSCSTTTGPSYISSLFQ